MVNKLIVDVAAIKANICKSRELTGAKICAVVKANCYGIGLELCKHIAFLVDYFAVATIAEALELRGIVDTKILVLSPPIMSDIALLNAHNSCDLEIAVDNLHTLKSIVKRGQKLGVQLVANTGMNRYGADKNEFLKMLQYANRHRDVVVVKGVFSHFLKDDKATKKWQVANFMPLVKLAKQFFPNAICHISNSGGQDYAMDMVRIGIGLYDPQGASITTLKSIIARIRYVNAGNFVGYNKAFVADKPTKVGVVPLGYADGIMRKFKGATVLVCGQLCKIIGNVCMDCFFVDLSNCKKAKVGADVVIWGKNGKNAKDVCNFAKHCGTINYELLTRLGSRIIRQYIDN